VRHRLNPILILLLPSTPPDPVEADIAWIASGQFCEPETVLPLPDDTLLISNVCGFNKTGNGYLSLLDVNGKVINWRIVDALDAPLGMVFHKGRIHVVDRNRVKSFAWPGFSFLGESLLGTKVANDIAASPDGTLYISDTGAGRVMALAPNGEQNWLTSSISFDDANGIEYGPDDALYVGGKRLWRVHISTGRAETVGPGWLADIDGIEFEVDGTIQVTPVGGPLVRLKRNGGVDIFGGKAVSSANHGYAANANLALIPTGFDNTVIAIRLPNRDAH